MGNFIPFLACISSGHSFPPLIAGLVTILYLNADPVASGADQSVQSDTIHGSGTTKKTSKCSPNIMIIHKEKQ